MPEVGTAILMRAEVTTTYALQTFKNVFWYIRTTGVTPDYEQWHTDFSNVLLQEIHDQQTSSVDMPLLSVVNVNSTDVPYEADPGFGGGPIGGEDLPPFVAAGIRLTRSTNETRHGQKRLFVGSETSMAGGAWLTADFLAYEAIADIMGADLVADSLPWSPVIVRRFTLAPDPVLLPVDGYIYNFVNGAVVNPNVTSQTTRKFGRGI